MSLLGDAERYASFLHADRRVPPHLGLWLGGFMIMCQRFPFFTAPSIWTRLDGDRRPMARVYFTPWSQNRLPALRDRPGLFYFCAFERDVFVRHERLLLRMYVHPFRNSEFSGSQTRSMFEQGKEGFAWLRSQLGATY